MDQLAIIKSMLQRNIRYLDINQRTIHVFFFNFLFYMIHYKNPKIKFTHILNLTVFEILRIENFQIGRSKTLCDLTRKLNLIY